MVKVGENIEKLAFLNLNKFSFIKLSMVENLEKHFDSGG